MAVAKFNWHSTNPNKSFQNQYPPKSYFNEMCKLNATKAETEAAYNALKNGGKVSDFKVKVWNDICAKAYDLCQEWGIHGNEIKVEVWSPFMHVDDREGWIAIAMKTWGWDRWEAEDWTDNNLYPVWRPGVFRAEFYNVLYGSWLLPVGLQKFEVRRGEPVKGEYILNLVEIINHWTELSPMDVRFLIDFGMSYHVEPVLLPYLSVLARIAMNYRLQGDTDLDESIQMQALLDIKLLFEKFRTVELTSCPLSSLLNFMKLNFRCQVWDKIPNYIMAQLDVDYNGSASPVLSFSRYLTAFLESLYWSSCNADTASALGGFGASLEGQVAYHVRLRLADAYGFSLATHQGQYHGSARIRTKRPMPFSARTQYSWNGSVLVDHEGTLLIFMEDGGIALSDSGQLDVNTTADMDQQGQIGIRNERVEPAIHSSAFMEPKDDEIVYHGPDIEGQVATAVQESHRDHFKTESTQTVQKTPADHITFEGNLPGMQGSAEMSFANEETFVMRDGAFGVREDDIQIDFQQTAVMDVADTYDTQETIILGDAPPLEIGGSENLIRTTDTAKLERDRTIEAAADSIIRSLQSGEVSFGLNANLEAELVAAKITSAAILEANRQATMEAKVDVATMEGAIADRVLRKLLESSVCTETHTRASLILSMIHFAESSSIVSVISESETVPRIPKRLQSKTQYITAQTDAFLDASYIRGDALAADAKIHVETDVMPQVVNSGTYLASLVIVQILTETVLGKMPSAALEGNALAATGSEAGVVLARSILILANAHEEKLASDEEELPATDFERTLTID